MAIVSGDVADYLGQSAFPDNSGDWTIVVWVNNLAPAIVLPSFRTALVLFEVDGDYSSEFLAVRYAQIDGHQQIKITGLSGYSSAFPCGTEEWHAIAVKYDSTAKSVRFQFRETNGNWNALGDILVDLSAVTWTALRLLSDGSGTANQIGGVAASFYRLWNGVYMNEAQLTAEAANAVAQYTTVAVDTDTQLQVADDLTDVSGNANNWTPQGSPGLLFNGPLAGDVRFYAPMSGSSQGMQPGQNVAAVVRGYFSIAGNGGDLFAATVSAGTLAAHGAVYFLQDDPGTGFTAITRLWHDNDVTSAPTTLHLGHLTGGLHCAMVLPVGTVSGEEFYADILTIDRDTGDVIRVSSFDGSLLQTYSLNLTTLDGAVNSAGDRLIYVVGTSLYIWKLDTDEDGGLLFDTPGAIYWPVWLPDCSVVVSTAGAGADGPIQRYRTNGELLHTFNYSPSPFAAGQLGIAANMVANTLYVVGAWNDAVQSDQAAVLRFTLDVGAQLGNPVPLIGNSSGDVVTCVTQANGVQTCTPAPPPPPAPTVFPVRRYMRFMLPWDDTNRRKFLSRLELIMQTGIGTADVPDPIVMLRLSWDGGKTFGNEIQMAAGAMGAYAQRVYVNRMGSGRNPVVEITTSDPVNWQFLQLLADLEEGTS